MRCDALAGNDAKGCAAEREAVKACEPKQAGAFMRCVRDVLQADPR